MPARDAASRGYGYRHRKVRAHWRPVVDSGRAACVKCGQQIRPGTAWDLDHTDDRTGWLGPAHASCNRADGARKTNAKRKQRPRFATSRAW